MATRTPHSAVSAAIAWFVAQTESRYLRTVYINPTFAINGDGTTWTQAATPGGAGAFNAWGSGTWTTGAIDLTHFWRDNTRYLQAAETQFSGNIIVYEVAAAPMAGILIGTHDPATGEQIRDNTRHARLWATTGIALHGYTASTKRQNLTLDNVDVRALARTTSGSNGVTNAAAAIDTYVGMTLIRCIADGDVGITIKGKGLRIYDCQFTGYADGLTAQSVAVEVLGCRLFDAADFPPINPSTWDSCSIEVLGNFTAELVRIEYNDFTKPIPSDKQAIYLYCGGVTNVNTPSGPVTIRHNKVSNANQCIYSALDNTEVAFNHVDLAWNHAYPDGSGGDPRAMTIIANNPFVHDNLVTNSPFALAISLSCNAGTARVHRNTFDGVEKGFTAYTNTFAVDWRDNVLVRSPQTVQTDADCVYIQHDSTVSVTASGNLYYGTADPATPFNVAWTYKTFAQYKADNEPTAQFAVPGYDARYRPVLGGNLHAAAGSIGASDMAGVARERPTSIGAYECIRARASRMLP